MSHACVFCRVQMARQHQEWLEDLVIRLLCIFALDRFGDFVSDEVSVPCLCADALSNRSGGVDSSRIRCSLADTPANPVKGGTALVFHLALYRFAVGSICT